MTSKNEIKEAFFELASEYLVIDQTFEDYKVYEFDKNDILTINWFIEMIWSISADFDIRILAESDYYETVRVFIRTNDDVWRLYE